MSTEIPTSMKVFIRLGFGFIAYVPFMLRDRSFTVRSTMMPLHLVRAGITLSAMLCTYYAYANLPLTTATSLGFSGPFFTFLLSGLFLKERLGLQKVLWLCVGYVGVLIVIRPDVSGLDKGVVASLTANALASIGILLAKKISRIDSTSTMLFYSNLISFFLAGIVAIPVWVKPNAADLLYLFVMGVCGVSSQFFYLSALKVTTPTFLAPFEYSRLLFAIPIGFIFFDHVPDLWMLVGGLVIIVSNYFINSSSGK